MRNDPWDMSDCDPYADIAAAIHRLNDPEEAEKARKRRAENEEALYRAIQIAYDSGMSPEKIFELINVGVIT